MKYFRLFLAILLLVPFSYAFAQGGGWAIGNTTNQGIKVTDNAGNNQDVAPGVNINGWDLGDATSTNVVVCWVLPTAPNDCISPYSSVFPVQFSAYGVVNLMVTGQCNPVNNKCANAPGAYTQVK